VIFVVPAAIPETTPALVTLAVNILLLLHDNMPVVALANVVVVAGQRERVPVMLAGFALTVATTDFEHVFGNV
jgi:hypothetical protein